MKYRFIAELDPEYYYFDEEAANYVINFIEAFIVHVEGKKAGEPFLLEEWQKEIIAQAYGVKCVEDDMRRYSVLFLEIPKKNGKSALASALAIFHLIGEEKVGANVYCAANSEKQAGLVYKQCIKHIEANPVLNDSIEAFQYMCKCAEFNSELTAIGTKAATSEGLKPAAIIVDEVHEMKDQAFYDSLTAGKIFDDECMVIVITTAGRDKNNIGWQLHEHAEKVNTGILKDDEFLGVIYAADEAKDDLFDEKTWRKANPNLGISKSLRQMRREATKAQTTPRKLNAFKRYQLNIWTESVDRWIKLKDWEKCSKKRIYSLKELQGRKCFGGLDLSNKHDLSSLVLLFPPIDKETDYIVKCWCWLPLDDIHEKALTDKFDYLEAERLGELTLTPGKTIDKVAIADKIIELSEYFDIDALGYDRAKSSTVLDRLEAMESSVEYTPLPQGWSLCPGYQELDENIINHTLNHGGNTILSWQAGHAKVTENRLGQYWVVKDHPNQKVDSIQCMGMAFLLSNMCEPEEEYKPLSMR